MSLGTNKQHAKAMIDRAIDAGINHLDTADLYDFGWNEEIVGDAIQDKRHQIVLSTKVGNHFNQKNKEWYWDPSKQYIKNAVKNSLKRLQTDYLDFCMLHGGTIEDPIDETIEAFESLKQAGYIRAYGISSIRPNVIHEYVKRSNIDGVMMQYSLLDRRPEEEILDLLHKNHISVLARGPLAKGILSKHGSAQIEKKASNGYLDYSMSELTALFERLKSLVDANGSSIHEIALTYPLLHPAVVTTVFGASSINQLEEAIEIDVQTPIYKDLYNNLQQITRLNTYTNHRIY